MMELCNFLSILAIEKKKSHVWNAAKNSTGRHDHGNMPPCKNRFVSMPKASLMHRVIKPVADVFTVVLTEIQRTLFVRPTATAMATAMASFSRLRRAPLV